MAKSERQRHGEPNLSYYHEYGNFRLVPGASIGLPLNLDNDEGTSYYAKLEIQNGGSPVNAKVIRDGTEVTIQGWVYKATSTDTNYPAKYTYFVFEVPLEPIQPQSSYVGYSAAFVINTTVFEQYRSNFTAHHNA